MPIVVRRTPLKVPNPKKLDLAKLWHLPNRPSGNRLKPWPHLGNKADKVKVSNLENLNQEKDNQARDNPAKDNPARDNPVKDKGLPPHLPAKPP